MFLWAKLRIGSTEDSGDLIRQFFEEEVDPQSSIKIEGEVAELSIRFDHQSIPKNLIGAISDREVIELRYPAEEAEPVPEAPTAKPVQEAPAAESVQETPAAEPVPKVPAETEAPKPEEAPQDPTATEVPKPAEAPQDPTATEVPKPAEALQDPAAEAPKPAEALQDPTATEVPKPAEAPQDPAAAEALKPEEVQQGHSSSGSRRKTNPIQRHPFLDNLARQSSNFDDFVRRLSDFLNLKTRQSDRRPLFRLLVIAAINQEKDSFGWKELKDYLKTENNRDFGQSDQVTISNAVTAKFQKQLAILDLLKILKNYDFPETPVPQQKKVENPQNPAVVAQRPEQVQQETASSTTTENSFITKFPCLVQALEDAKKMQSVNEKVGYVLSAMGLSDFEPEKKRKVLSIVNGTMPLREITSKNVEEVCFLGNTGEYLNERMTLAAFLTQFKKTHNHPELDLKALDFLKELQSHIVPENQRTL